MNCRFWKRNSYPEDFGRCTHPKVGDWTKIAPSNQAFGVMLSANADWTVTADLVTGPLFGCILGEGEKPE